MLCKTISSKVLNMGTTLALASVFLGSTFTLPSWGMDEEVMGSFAQKKLEKFLGQQDYSQTYRSVKASGNAASDEEIIGFILKYPEWDILNPNVKKWAVDKVVTGARRSTLEEFFAKQDYPQAYRSIKGSGNPSSDEEIVGYLLSTKGYTSWGSLPPKDKTWAVDKVVTGARRSTLEEFLSKQNYSPAYHVIKTAGNPLSDEAIVGHILESKGYTAWDSLLPEEKAWTIGKITQPKETPALKKFLSQQDFVVKDSKSVGMSKDVRSKEELAKIWEGPISSTDYFKLLKIELASEVDELPLSFVRMFQVHPQLQKVEIRKTSMGMNDRGRLRLQELAENIKTNKTVKELWVTQCNVDDEGARHLSEMLKVNTTLTHLYLDFNNVGDEGAKAIGESLKVNTTLQHLSFVNTGAGHKMTNEGVKDLTNALYLQAHNTPFVLDLLGFRANISQEKLSIIMQKLETKNVKLKFQ